MVYEDTVQMLWEVTCKLRLLIHTSSQKFGHILLTGSVILQWLGICDLKEYLSSFPSSQSKPDSSELGSPKTTDDIVQERGEEGRAARRRHKTEVVKQQWSHEKAMAVELEQAQRCILKSATSLKFFLTKEVPFCSLCQKDFLI